jgi:hypothetical protein
MEPGLMGIETTAFETDLAPGSKALALGPERVA